jgi:hypothetical protein
MMPRHGSRVLRSPEPNHWGSYVSAIEAAGAALGVH